ncbi:MAG: O-acetyl-ADP-ribose deacetylase [Acutalibacteraceae bacterium]
MPLKIVRNDITKMPVDAIVNAAKNSLLGGGGVDGCIHKAAGKGLLEECKTLGGCNTGEAKITGAYNLPCKYVIHTVGPVWKGGIFGEKRLLESCYTESLRLAEENGCETVAFPLISSGVYGYPKDKALKVAVDTIGNFLLDNEMTVYIVIFDKAAFSIGKKLFSDISEYIDDKYAKQYSDYDAHRRNDLDICCLESMPYMSENDDSCDVYAMSEEKSPYTDETEKTVASFPLAGSSHAPLMSLDERLKTLDESFSQMLLREIDEKGMTDVQCYKKANIDRKLFSKIRSDINYRPSKQTAIAFAVALELTLTETEDFLKKAGFALSHSNKFDIIIEYFISKGNYNIFEINEALFAFDQSLLGA